MHALMLMLMHSCPMQATPQLAVHMNFNFRTLETSGESYEMRQRFFVPFILRPGLLIDPTLLAGAPNLPKRVLVHSKKL